MVLILTLNICNDYPNNLVNTSQRMEQEKYTQILMKVNEQKTVHSFFYKNNFERTMRFTGK